MEYFEKSVLKNQFIVISGAGSGIGKCFAKMAVSLGAKVALCGRRLELLEETAKEINYEYGNGKVIYSSCDIRDIKKVEEFGKFVLKEFGRVDVLVNNAGGQFPINAEALTAKGFDAVIRNNLNGTFNMISTFANLAFIPQNSGKIINIIANIIRGFPGMVHTGAARAGVDNMTKTLSVEWARFGITINSIAPGIIVSSTKNNGTDRYPPEFIENAKNATPLNRCGTEEEVAYMITFLSSKASLFITGQTYYVDGGLSVYGDYWRRDIPQERKSKM